MEHAITLGDLLRVAGWGLGILLLLAGAFTVFAAGMSSSPSTAREIENSGCLTVVFGLGVLALMIGVS